MELDPPRRHLGKSDNCDYLASPKMILDNHDNTKASIFLLELSIQINSPINLT